MGMIWVKAHPKSGEKVALWEVDDRHPANAAGEHEVFIAGQDQEAQEVFETTLVLDRIKGERLVKVDAPAAPAAPAKKGAKAPAGATPEELAAAEAARLEAEAAAEAAKNGGS